MDIKAPEDWPAWRIRLLVLMNKPFGASLSYVGQRKPWEAIDEYLTNVSFTELHGGVVFISSGEKP
jgi:hypothetical protein